MDGVDGCCGCGQEFVFLPSLVDLIVSPVFFSSLHCLGFCRYYMELAFQTNGLMSLRLLRLFRVMQLVRLGQYNKTFMSLTTVLSESLIYLKLLLGVLLFAAAFFGSMIYWLEKGDWKYWPETKSYQFIRLNPQGIEEISPYKSIPDTFWWFFVTATTVGCKYDMFDDRNRCKIVSQSFSYQFDR